MNRRQFLHGALLGASVPLIGLNRQAMAAEFTPHKRRLVLVELAGANDGLNTLAPYSNDDYHRLRPTIGLAKNDIIALSEALGIHSSLQPLMALWERGELAWLQGLGYPKANRSHFKSIAIWETAGDGKHSRSSQGWMTHAIEHQLARTVHDPHGISLAGSMSIFASESGRWLTARSSKDLLQKAPPSGTPGAHTHATLALLQQRLQSLDNTLTAVARKLDPARFSHQIPAFKGGAFGEQLRQVALLIRAGLDTPVYRVQLGGFDTHQGQQARHKKLLTVLAESLSNFSDTLRDLAEWDNTIVMTYSEFGRRANENKSRGTDHGTAAPHMLLGGAIAGGLYGEQPDLADLPNGDPRFTMDYRALYHHLLVQGLGADRNQHTLEQYADTRLNDLIRNG